MVETSESNKKEACNLSSSSSAGLFTEVVHACRTLKFP